MNTFESNLQCTTPRQPGILQRKQPKVGSDPDATAASNASSFGLWCLIAAAGIGPIRSLKERLTPERSSGTQGAHKRVSSGKIVARHACEAPTAAVRGTVCGALHVASVVAPRVAALVLSSVGGVPSFIVACAGAGLTGGSAASSPRSALRNGAKMDVRFGVLGMMVVFLLDMMAFVVDNRLLAIWLSDIPQALRGGTLLAFCLPSVN